MTHENFNTGLSREYLEYLGITNITEDGRIYKGEKELTSSLESGGYLQICLNDKEGKKRFILTHRAVYAWHKGYIPPRMQIDHVSGDCNDNRISNLRLATAAENGANRHCKKGTYEMRCSMKFPREHYEAMLDKAKELPKGRTRTTKVSQAKAKLRYWDTHAEEYNEYLAKKEVNTQLEEQKTEARRLTEAKIRLKFCAKKYKELGNLSQWHTMNNLVKNASLLPVDKVEEIAQRHFDRLAKIV